ncbi:hypothetical protein CASFOL_027692 [Castilleja foliolosa]|uniref:Uncharacterized protein n=1 Tax=Castilleja foliolosa TaxID=1961234 RepID=A0ABD3CI35_9LAMI
MELESNISSSNLSSASASSDVMDPKRIAMPSAVTRISRIYKDDGIHKLVKEVKIFRYLKENSKKFLDSLEGIRNHSTEVSAEDIYKRAREIWEFEQSLASSCSYGIKKDSDLDLKLVSCADNKTAAERVILMMEDPWFEYILGERVYWSKNSEILRGFLSIFIAYWNMDDLNRKYKMGKYRLSYNEYTTEHDWKIDELKYVIKHVDDFGNLEEVVYSKYGSDPDLAANVLEQLKKFQVERMNLRRTWVSGKRARIKINLVSEGSSPPRPCGTFAVYFLKK